MKKIFVAEIKKASYICDDGYVILANDLDQAKDIAVAKFKKKSQLVKWQEGILWYVKFNEFIWNRYGFRT